MDHFRPDDFDRKDKHATNDYEETSFITPGVDTARTARVDEAAVTTSLHQELLQSAVDSCYNAMAEKRYPPTVGRHISKFELACGQLRLKVNRGFDLIHCRTGEPLTL